jgi:hypothetical protein
MRGHKEYLHLLGQTRGCGEGYDVCALRRTSCAREACGAYARYVLMCAFLSQAPRKIGALYWDLTDDAVNTEPRQALTG